ncbi:peroxiredoxin Q/BCP [Rhizobiales bacterium GAS188]|nr:peroxiredoxin Q/BCP [Rhizobiales bacterium GAS188]
MAQLGEGDAAPDFKLPGDDGGEIALASFKGEKLVLYFYPKADTSGCTKEANEFNDLLKDFGKAGVRVLAVSPDPVKALHKFKTKYGLGFKLVGDESHAMLEAYGVWAQKSMYGRSYMGVERSTFLIGKDGRIAKAWRKVKVEGHASEVLDAARAL